MIYRESRAHSGIENVSSEVRKSLEVCNKSGRSKQAEWMAAAPGSVSVAARGEREQEGAEQDVSGPRTDGRTDGARALARERAVQPMQAVGVPQARRDARAGSLKRPP